jgi:hypothetical protein
MIRLCNFILSISFFLFGIFLVLILVGIFSRRQTPSQNQPKTQVFC